MRSREWERKASMRSRHIHMHTSSFSSSSLPSPSSSSRTSANRCRWLCMLNEWDVWGLSKLRQTHRHGEWSISDILDKAFCSNKISRPMGDDLEFVRVLTIWNLQWFTELRLIQRRDFSPRRYARLPINCEDRLTSRVIFRDEFLDIHSESMLVHIHIYLYTSDKR